jgi:hypothetical protein
MHCRRIPSPMPGADARQKKNLTCSTGMDTMCPVYAGYTTLTSRIVSNALPALLTLFRHSLINAVNALPAST